MTKEEYLRQLGKYLNLLPKEDYESAMQYFQEYFSDSGEENTEQVIKELGPPKEAAAELLKNLIEEDPPPDANAKYTNKQRHFLILFLTVALTVGMPVILMILLFCLIGLILLGVAFSLIMTCAFAAFAAGIRDICSGFAYIRGSLAAACTLGGAGLIECGLAIAVIWINVLVCKWVLKALGILLEKIYLKYIAKRKQEGVGKHEME